MKLFSPNVPEVLPDPGGGIQNDIYYGQYLLQIQEQIKIGMVHKMKPEAGPLG